MDYSHKAERLDNLLDCIKKGRAKNPSQLALLFGCTEKTIRNCVNLLRRKGHIIRWCKTEKTYVWMEE